MDINEIASKLDIGFTLAEITDNFKYHGIKVDEEKSIIDICCFKIVPLEEIKVTLSIGRNYVPLA